jgi:choice-of-anchor A domain-containing protein
LGIAGEHNLYAALSIDLNRSDIGGTLAAGESVFVRKSGLGTMITELQDTLVAGTTLDANGVEIFGNAIYGESITLKTVRFKNGGAALQGSPIDFEAATGTVTSLCGEILDLPVNGEVITEGTEMQLIGTDPDSNVFEVAAEELGDGIWIAVSVPPGATAIVRGTGTGVVLRSIGIELDGASTQTVLWSFCEAESLTIGEMELFGSVLAPHAEVFFDTATVDGTVVARSMSGAAHAHPVPFKGCVLPSE